MAMAMASFQVITGAVVAPRSSLSKMFAKPVLSVKKKQEQRGAGFSECSSVRFGGGVRYGAFLRGEKMGAQAITEAAETSGGSLPSVPVDDNAAVEHAQPRTFVGITTEEGLLNAIRFESEAKSLPPRASAGMVELYRNYRDAIVSSGVANAREISVRIMATVLDRILLQFEEPFTFPSYHKRILYPYDYYTFGQNYVRPLINFGNSYVGNADVFAEIETYLKQGHNVFLFANHQTEADPAVMALLLESRHPYLAENLTYIAGDRVVLDPFCKPFSMGRNLLCVYSKKHIYDVPELFEMKQRANTKALKDLTALLKKGGQLIWIAPSGGRDRPDPVTDEWTPATFDASSVDNMRRLLGIMPVVGHMYTMALICYDVMPPPHKVEKELGEARLVGHTGVGLSVSHEIDFDTLSAGTTTKEEARDQFTSRIFDTVKEQYSVLKNAIYGSEGVSAGSAGVQLSQPWLKPQNSLQKGHIAAAFKPVMISSNN